MIAATSQATLKSARNIHLMQTAAQAFIIHFIFFSSVMQNLFCISFTICDVTGVSFAFSSSVQFRATMT